MAWFSYFAYGSNMLLERLRAKDRCPSARVMGPASAVGVEVKFAKRSKDGSGKATLIRVEGATTYGVLFAIDESERESLMKAEGAGYYWVDDFAMRGTLDGRVTQAMTFFASADYFAPDLQPFDWYLALSLAGGKQNALPEDYVRKLGAVASMPDPVKERATRLEALRALREAGMEVFV